MCRDSSPVEHRYRNGSTGLLQYLHIVQFVTSNWVTWIQRWRWPVPVAAGTTNNTDWGVSWFYSASRGQYRYDNLQQTSAISLNVFPSSLFAINLSFRVHCFLQDCLSSFIICYQPALPASVFAIILPFRLHYLLSTYHLAVCSEVRIALLNKRQINK